MTPARSEFPPPRRPAPAEDKDGPAPDESRLARLGLRRRRVARRRRQRLLGALLAVVGFAAVILTWYLLVFTETGQLMEHAALVGSRIGSRFVSAQARTLLHVVSLPAAVALVLLILVVGLWRGSRRRGAWAAAAVVATNASAQALKYWALVRPDYGLSQRSDGGNTLPSGHTALAASAAVALILVAGPRWRSLSAWVGALFTAAMGYSTLVNQWHRPGDVIAAILLAAAWGCAAIACGAWRRDVDEGLEPVRLTGLGSLALLGVVCALIGAGLEVRTWRDAAELAGRTDTFLAYAAGSAGTLAVACLSMAAMRSAAVSVWVGCRYSSWLSRVGMATKAAPIKIAAIQAAIRVPAPPAVSPASPGCCPPCRC